MVRCHRMTTANINNRQSLERAYPAEAFAADASENDRHRIELLKGVRILSAPDRNGNFDIERATKHTGETPGTVFLAPFHRATAEENATADPDPRHGYEAFLDEIMQAAGRAYRSENSPGAGDERLRGPRQ